MVGVSWFLSCALFYKIDDLSQVADLVLYTWANAGDYAYKIGLWLDALTVMMMMVVTGISFLVHLYSVGYMAEDKDQVRYFSYVSFFTFAMLLLVMGDNLLQLFIGWEGVGVASYLLIGFWQTESYPAKASIKAFIVNRVGDFGLLIAIGLLLGKAGGIHFTEIFTQVSLLKSTTGLWGTWVEWICLGLLIGAMGKSAQFPLHVWLPDSMAGPTPISALIHAATMVTAGIYLICRFSPLFEYAPYVQGLIVCIGSTGMILFALLALVEFDIKRIIAFSTLSQLGMMIAVCGASGYSVALYHLATHACFKALLFLGAGAIIIAMHHEQDIRRVGRMRSNVVVHLSILIGSLSMVAIPPLSGFFSKDAIILAMKLSKGWASSYGYACLMLSVVLTALYSARLYFWVFWRDDECSEPTSIPLSMVIPLWILILLSAVVGWQMASWVGLGGLSGSLFITSLHQQGMSFVMGSLIDPGSFALHALFEMPVYLAILGLGMGWQLYYVRPGIPDYLAAKLSWVYQFLRQQVYVDMFYERFLVRRYGCLSRIFYQRAAQQFLDQGLVLGSANAIQFVSRHLQSVVRGGVHYYVLAMLFGLLFFLLWLL